MLFRSTLMRGVKQNIERDGSLSPVAFVVATRDPQTGAPYSGTELHVLSLESIMTKEAETTLAEQVRAYASAAGAVTVAVATESWSLRKKRLTEEDREILAREGVAGHPDREEHATFVMEHVSGTRVWAACIRRGADDSVKLEPFILQKNPMWRGPLRDLLPSD